ncbi:ATP-dependent RNA helicase-like protein DB10, partial [Durusdinium trenchii]
AKTPSFGPYALILTPTRELALQIARDAAGLCKATGIKMACLYGGTSKGDQIKSLHFGVDQLICTPGRLDDLVSKPDKFTGQSILSLSMVHYVVLDEADCMLDLGFEPQVRRLLQHVAEQRQILCFSATWPKKVQALTKELLPDAIHIKVGASDGISGNRDVEQHVRLLTGDRFQELKTILQSHPNQACIIFCALKKTAASLNRWLREESFASGAIHGNLMQQERIEVMEQFRKEELKILVATDVAARGLDLKRILVVVNYESPVSLDAHVHRVGRTGRAGQRGHAYSLLEPEDVQYARMLSESFRSAGQAVPGFVANLAARPLLLS